MELSKAALARKRMPTQAAHYNEGPRGRNRIKLSFSVHGRHGEDAHDFLSGVPIPSRTFEGLNRALRRSAPAAKRGLGVFHKLL